MRITSLVVVAGMFAAALPAAASAASIVNGSFEAGVNPGSFTTLANGSHDITGWTVVGRSVDYIGDYWQAADGERSVDLNGIGSGGLSQSIATVLNQKYFVSFSLAGNPDGLPVTKSVLSIASGSGNVGLTSFFTTTGHSKADMGWTDYTYSFIAKGPSTLLTFRSQNEGNFGAALDNVAISVPEPSTWAMMILGIGMAGGALRRRRHAMRFNFA